MSTFKTIPIDGPHVVRLGTRGLYTFPLRVFDVALPGSVATGDLELEVVLDGRLVAPDVAGLDATIGALLAEATYPAEAGPFIDPFGRVFDDMTLVSIETGDVVVGLRTSIDIVLTFRRFTP